MLTHSKLRKAILAVVLSALSFVSLVMAVSAFAAVQEPPFLAVGASEPRLGCSEACYCSELCPLFNPGVYWECCDEYCWHPAGYWYCKSGWWCCGWQIAYQYGCSEGCD
jgi:hypothetical protein